MVKTVFILFSSFLLFAILLVTRADETDRPNPVLYLPASEGKALGGVIHKGADRDLTRFKRAGKSGVRWDLPISLPTGGYEIYLHLHKRANTSGKIIISDGYYYQNKEIPVTQDNLMDHKFLVGTLRIRNTAQKITLLMEELSGENLFILLALEIVSVKDS